MSQSPSGKAKIKMDKARIEAEMTGPLSAALVAVAVFTLSLIGNVQDPSKTWHDELLATLGLVSLISAARTIDHAFDKIDLNTIDRVTLIGGGYVLFCVVVGAMSFAISLLCTAKNLHGLNYNISLIIAGFLAFAIICLLMTHRGTEIWVFCIFILLAAFAVNYYYGVEVKQPDQQHARGSEPGDARR